VFALAALSLSVPGNPLEEKHTQEGDWRDTVANKLKKLSKLDGQSKRVYFL